MRQLGLAPDKHAANAAVSRWLREVANARVHATTERSRPSGCLPSAPSCKCFLPPMAGDRHARDTGGVRKAVLGYQHPLAVYDTLLMEAAA